jgi:hypothetical protein
MVGVLKGAGARQVLMAAAALVLLAGCERQSVMAQGAAGAGSAGGQASYGGRNDARGGGSEGGGYARQDENVRLLDGKPIWSSSRKGSAEDNAQRSWQRNGQAFGAHDEDDYIRKARAFVENPPAGVEKINRRNGDTLFYDAKTNVFAVANRAGTPKAMFKPDRGADYWRQQKDREAQGGGRGGQDQG